MKQSKMMLEDVHVDPETGHITLTVRMHTTDGKATWHGPRRPYGCDVGMFQGMFAGDIEQLKNWVYQQHAALTGAHLGFVDTLMKMKGTRIGPVQNLDPEAGS